MIQSQQQPLPQPQSDAIIRWLNKPEAEVLIACVAGEIAHHQAAACRLIVDQPVAYLTGGKIPQSSEQHLAEASKLRIFLDVLSLIRAGTKTLNHTTVAINI